MLASRYCVWDQYFQSSLKASARSKRGKEIRRRVLPDSKIPGNWASFLRVDENKTELFRFLADEAIKIDTEKTVVSSRTNVAITNGNSDLSFISPCCQEEANTRLFLHVKDASRNGYSKFAIRTVDTDVVIIALGLFEKLNTQELSIAFGTGKKFPLYCCSFI